VAVLPLGKQGTSVTTIYDQRTPATRSLTASLGRSLTRNEFFAGLYILGCLNGLGGAIFQAASSGDWAIREVNVIVWFAFMAGVSLLLGERSDTAKPIKSMDIAVALLFLGLIALPADVMSWVAVTGLSLYVLLFARESGPRIRGATILLALTVPMLWSRVLFALFAKFFLEIDATLVAWFLGTTKTGNILRFADNSGDLVIMPACSSMANVSLALLCWVTATQWTDHRWSPWDILWCGVVCSSVVAINVTRITVEGLSHWHWATFHSPMGDMIVGTAILIFTVGLTVLGVRRELFARV
jgi:hypothetical protein